MLTRRRILAFSGAILVVGALLIGLFERSVTQRSTTQSVGVRDSTKPIAKPTRELPKPTREGREPSALLSLRLSANKVLTQGLQGFRRQMADLKGYPVVVNKWASWCGPCAAEHPIMASVAERFEGKVAFVGIASQDSPAEVKHFLRRHFLPYPTYAETGEKIARSIGASGFSPVTLFYDSHGKRRFIRYGAYQSERQLAAEIRRHLGSL